FQLTHVVEPMMMPDQKEVDKFLPAYKPYAALHPDNIVSMGALGMPDIFNEAMMAKDDALINSKKVILEVWKEWEEKFGRKYEPIGAYRMDGAEVALLTLGSMGDTAEVAIDELREKGVKAGLLKLKLWRPFPTEELLKAVKGLKSLAVIDRAVSFGGVNGPVAAEIKAALYDQKERPLITNYIIGLGGRDVVVTDFVKMVQQAISAQKKKPKEAYEIYGVRGS
ncbi:MAG: pyruvate ferredoxin oxidoreductase, partial [Deltaproteobacteria bacterium]|nr:pyruvate ferredoxin oxidoreductase [Deltaproteobacteria bacterium]